MTNLDSDNQNIIKIIKSYDSTIVKCCNCENSISIIYCKIYHDYFLCSTCDIFLQDIKRLASDHNIYYKATIVSMTEKSKINYIKQMKEDLELKNIINKLKNIF